MQRKWRRAWKRGKPHWARNKHRQKKQVVKLRSRRQHLAEKIAKNLRPVAASVALFGMLATQPFTVMANTIVADGKTATSIVDKGNNITDISTGTYSTGGKIGFNSFKQFDISKGSIVNLQLGAANNLINLVNDSKRSTIYGTLNSIKNNEIGGHVYFLNPYGLLVGASGVINVGSFTAMTPMPGSISSFNGNDLDTWGTKILSGSLPLNSSGSITVQGKINAMNDIKLTAGAIEHSGTLFSRAYFTATSPDFSDVVNVNGQVSGTKFAINDGKIEIVAENIHLKTGAVITAKGHEGAADGDISLISTDKGSLDNGIFSQGAAISLDGATLSGKNITFDAAAGYTDNALLGITVHNASATIDVKDSTIDATGDVNMRAAVDMDVNAKTPSFLAKLTGDSAYAGAVVDSTAQVKVYGTTEIKADGDVSLAAQNKINLTISANPAENTGESGQINSGNHAGGGSLGFGSIKSKTEAGITGQATISKSKSIAINAASANKITTEAIASIMGTKAQETAETSETSKKLKEYAADVQTSEGGVTAAAALGINDITSITKAYMESGAASKSAGSVAVTSKAVNQSSVTADGSAVESGATGVGVAVGINKVSSDNQAYVNQTIEAKDLSVQAGLHGTDASSMTTEVSSGAGATNVGVAGALAVNVHVNESLAQIGSKGNIKAETVNVTAENESKSMASALPSDDASGDNVGVGASIATNIGINHVTAEIANGAKLSGGRDVTVSATGSHSLETEAQAGSVGGMSVTPVVAVTFADNQTLAKVGSGDILTLGGDLTVKADNVGSSKTTAEGQADGEKAAVGVVIGLTIAVDEAEAAIERNINADGGVTVQADNAGSSETVAIASAAGGKPAQDDGSVQEDKEVNEQVKDQTALVAKKDVVKDKASDKAQESLQALPKAETSEGSVSVAAAVGINVGTSSANAYTLDGKQITTGDMLAIKTTNNSTAAATAEGKAVSQEDTDGNKVGIGAAVAVNVAKAANQARLGVATHNAKGLEISATMRNMGTEEDPATTNNFSAQATSGAGGSNVGVAGSVAVNTVTNTTMAEVVSGAIINAGSGNVTIRAAQQSNSEAKALPTEDGVEGETVGVGASVAVNTLTESTKASIGTYAGVADAGVVKVIASADSDTNTEATAGSAGGVAIDAVAAVTTLNQTTVATIDTGSALNAAAVEVRSTSSGDHTATATGDTESENVGVGASASVITSNTLASATIKRDVISAGNITIAAMADRSYEAVATASSKGAKGLDDGETAPSDPTNVSAKALKDTANEQKGTSGGKTVDVAAAVGVSVIKDDVEAGITGGTDSAHKRLVSTGGKLSVTADTISDFSSRGSGAALDPTAKAGIGVGVGISVARNNTAASIGDNTTIKAKGDVTVAAESLQNTSGAFINKPSAEGVSGAGSDKVGVAGALAVAYSDSATQATVGNKVSITGQDSEKKAGNITVQADNTSKLSAKAWSAALSKSAGVGASVATIVSDNDYIAAVGNDGNINANSLSVQAVNHKVSGKAPVDFETDDLDTLKESLTEQNLQIILGQNNYYTEAIAGSASGKVAVTGAAAVNNFEDTTQASVGSGTAISTNGAVNISSGNDTTAKAFVTSVALSSGNAGVGLVSTDIINSSETSSMFAGDIANSGSVTITANATQDAGVFGLGGGLANTAGVSGVATVVAAKNIVNAEVTDNAVISTTGSVLVNANNDFDALNIAGSIAVGGTAGVGAAVGTTNVRAETQARIGKDVIVNAGQDTTISAAATENLNTIAAGGAGGGTAGVAGSSVVETVNVKTKAFVDTGAELTSGKSVQINASDDTTIGSFGGAVSFGGTAGVGAGAVVEVINKDTEASIKNSGSGNKTVVNAGQDVVVDAQSSESITAAAASAAGGGTAGVAGSGIVYVVSNKTSGYIGDSTDVHAAGNVAVSAQDATTVNLLAGNVAVGGTAGVGGAADVNVITKDTDAHIGKNALVQADGKGAAVQVANGKFVADNDYTPGTNEIATPDTKNLDKDAADELTFIVSAMNPVIAEKQSVSGVAVSAVSLDSIRSGAVGAAGGGTAGVQGSLSAGVTDSTTKAYIDRGADINTDQSVLVAAGSDFHRLATAGAVAVGGTAGVGLGNDTAVRTADTEAYIAQAAQVTAKKDIAVNANAAENIFSVTAAGAAGLNAGVAGALSVNVINNTTKAYIEDAATDADKAVIKADNNLRLAANDDTNFAVMDGGVGFAILGGGVGGSVNVAVINKDTQAYIGDRAQVEALGKTAGANHSVYSGADTKTKKNSQGLAVEAVSTEKIADAVAAGGGSFVGVAGAVAANIITANTEAHIGSDVKAKAKDVNVTAVDDKELFSASGSAGIGVGGLAGSFNINIIGGNTTAYIDAAEVTASQDVAVNALATKDITVGTVSAGGGVVGVAGSVSVLSLGGVLTDEHKAYLNTNGSATGDIDNKAKNDQVKSMIGSYTYTDENGNNIAAQATDAIGKQTNKISVSDVVNKKPLATGTSATIREGAKIIAGKDVALNARDHLQLTATTAGASVGAAAAGAAVTVLSLDNDTTAIIGGGAEIKATGKLTTLADWQQKTTANSTAGVGGGFGALGAAVAIVDDDSDVRAASGNVAKLTAQGVGYQATSQNNINTQAINLAIGGGLSLGASVADVSLKGSTKAYIGADSVVTSTSSSAVNVNANTDNQVIAKAQGGTAGFAGLGATVVLVKDESGTASYLGDNASIEQAGAVGIKADYKGDVSAEAIVVAGGFVGAGASVAQAEITGINQAYTGTGSKVGQTAGKTVKSLQISADNQSTAKAKAIAGAAGVGAGSGSAATAVVNPTSMALIADDTKIKTTGNVTVQVTGTATADADASGLNVGGLAVGASVAKATNTPKLTAGIGANNELIVGGNLLVKAHQTVNSDANAVAAGGGLIGANATVATADSGTQVNSYIGSGGTATVIGNSQVEADAETKQNAKATAVVGGFYAAGASVAEARANTDTAATVGGQLTAANVGITAKDMDDNFAESIAGSGGVVSGAATVVKTSANGSTQAALADGAKLTANTLAINAARTTKFNATANGLNASALGASGIIAQHVINTDAVVAIGNNVTTATKSDTILKAANNSVKDWIGGSGDKADWNLAAAAGGVATGAAVDSDIHVTHTAIITVGNSSKLTVGRGGTVGSFTADAESDMTLFDKARINAGGAIAAADVDSRIKAKGNTKVAIGNAEITSDTGEIRVGSKNNANLDNRVAADAYGVAGAPAGTAYSEFEGNNQVIIAEGAKIIADKDVHLAVGRNTSGASGTINANAVVNLWNKTAVPINSKPDPKANIISDSTLTIDGYVGSANDIYLTADKGTMNASYTGVGKDLYREGLAEVGSAISNLFGGGDVNLDIKGGSKSTAGTADVAVNTTGTVETGLKRVKELSFGGSYQSDGNGGYYWLYDPETLAGENVTYSIERNRAISEGMTDRINELRQLRAAYSGDEKAVAAYDAEILFLQEKMVKMGLASWDTTGGGKVFVPGTSAGSGAISPKESAEATVKQMETTKSSIDVEVSKQETVVSEAETYRGLVADRDAKNEVLQQITDDFNLATETLNSYINNTANFTAEQKPIDKADAEAKIADELMKETPDNELIKRYEQAIDYFDRVSIAEVAVNTAQTDLTNAKKAIISANSTWNSEIALSVVDEIYTSESSKLTALTTQQTALEAAIVDLRAAILSGSLSDEVPDGPTADFITLKPITARLGDIRISADNLTGTGKLLAHGDAKINITNNSPAFLTVKDLTVRDGGSIFFNGALVKSNADFNTSFAEIKTKYNTPKPSITIESTFNPDSHKVELKKEDGTGTGKYVAIGVAPDITLAQNSLISNLNGSVQVRSNKGSIYSNGSINAGTVDIDAANGDFVQSYVDGFTHIGGDPEQIKKGTAEPGGIIANGNIFISARYINVNGLIQSGIADWTLTLKNSNDIRVSVNGSTMTLTQAQNYYKNNPGSNGLYSVVSGYSGNIGEKGYVMYNAGEDRFEVGGVEVNGGLVQLHGQIMNTAAGGASTGKIRALDGYGKISITNNSGKDIVLQNLNTGEGNAGVIDITDTGRNVQTVYTSSRGNVTVTENGVQKATSGYHYTKNGERGTLIYQPLDNMYYNWTTGTDSSVTKYYHYEKKDVFGITYSTSLVNDSTLTKIVYGQETPLPNGIYLSINKPFADSDSPNGHTQVIQAGEAQYNLIKEWTKRKWYTLGIAGTYYQDYTLTTPNKNITTYSVSASNPIGIEFFGQNQGELTVSGNDGNVLLQGVLSNKEGNTKITTNKDIIQADSSALISTSNLTLNASGSVGSKNEAVRAVIIDGTLNASASNGSVNVTQVLGDLKLGTVTADKGTLRLTADGNIANAATISNVRGLRIELTSNNGAIGGESAPLVVKTGNTTDYLNPDYGLKVYALKDINIENKTWTGKNDAGNLLIDTVESQTGNVKLKTPGQMIDNNTDEQFDRRTWDELTNYWDSLQLRADTDDNKAKQDQTIHSYINSKNLDYQTYWQLKSSIVDGKYVFADGEEAALKAQGINTADFAAAKLAKYKQLVEAGVDKWNNGQYADNFTYTLTESEKASLLKGSSWSDRELAISLAPGALKQLTDTVPIVKTPNVKGKHVTLDAGKGIGANLAPIVISANIMPQDLTPEQKVALAAAERADIVIDNAAKTINITQRKPVNVEAGGLLTATSGSFAYLGSEANVALNYIRAEDNVRLKIAGNIVAGDLPGANDRYVIIGKDIILESADGGIGTDAVPLNLGHSGTITARAAGDIYLYQDETQGDMKVDTIYSLKDVSLEAEANIRSSDDNEEGRNIMSQSLKLKAGKGIGTNAKSLGISVDGSTLDEANKGELTAEAQTGIYLSHIGDSLSVAKATTATGNINLAATGGSMTLREVTATAGSISAQAGVDLDVDTLTAASNIDLIAGKDITANQLTAKVDSIQMRAGNDITATNIKAGSAATILAGNNLTANTVETVHSMNLTAISGSIDVRNMVTTSGNIVAQAGADLIGNTLTSAGNINLTASQDIETDTVQADGSIEMEAGHDLTVDNTTAGGSITFTAGNDITAGDTESGTSTVMMAEQNVRVTDLAVGTDASLTAINGTMNLQQVKSNAGNITAEVATNLYVDALEAAGNVDFVAGNDIKTRNIQADGSIEMEAGYDLTINSTTAGENIILTAGNNITAGDTVAGASTTMMTGQNVSVTDLTVGTDASLTAKNGTMSLQQVKSSAGNITAETATNLHADTLEAIGNISLTAGQDIEADNTWADGSIEMEAGHDSYAGNTTAGGSITLTAGNDIIANNTESGTSTAMTAGQNMSVTDLTVGTDASLTTINGTMNLQQVKSNAGNITVGAATDLYVYALEAAGNIDFVAGNDVETDNIRADGSIEMEAGHDLTVNSTTAGGSIIFTVGNDITAGDTESGTSTTMTAGQNVSVSDLTVGTDASLTAKNGTMSLKQVKSSTGNVTVEAATDLSVDALEAKGNINLKSGHDIHVNQIKSTDGDLFLTADRSITNVNNGGDINLIGNHLTLTAHNGDIGAADKRVVLVVPGNVDANAGNDIYLEARYGNLNASNLVSRQGDVNALVVDGSAIVDQVSAVHGSVTLDASGGITVSNLSADSLELNSKDAGETLELGQVSLGKSMKLTADHISIDSIEHTDSSDLLRLSLSGGSKYMADTIDVTISSDIGVTFTTFAADQANVQANADNVNFLDTRIGSWANFRNNKHYVYASNIDKHLADSDLQLMPENNSFYLYMAADRQFKTNALVINYHPDYLVNGASNENSLIKQTSKLTTLSNTVSESNSDSESLEINANLSGFNGGLQTLSKENTVQIIGGGVNTATTGEVNTSVAGEELDSGITGSGASTGTAGNGVHIGNTDNNEDDKESMDN